MTNYDRCDVALAAFARALAAPYYDYTLQVWIKDGKYVACAHIHPCSCYGKIHAGEPARDVIRAALDASK